MTAIISFDGLVLNDGTFTTVFDYSYSLPGAEAQSVERDGLHPLIGGLRRGQVPLPAVNIAIADTATLKTSQRTLYSTFSPDRAILASFIIEDDDATNRRYLTAQCVSFRQVPGTGGQQFRAVLAVSGDRAFNSTTLNSDTESVTTDGQEWTITNDGDQEARPVIKVEPTGAITGDNPYRRFMAVKWRGDLATQYPTDIANGSYDTRTGSTNHASATGNDLRVRVNGLEVDFWLHDINTANTHIWVNLDWAPVVTMTLETAIAATGTIETIDVNEDISGAAPTGLLMINSEIFLYSAKNDTLRRFTIEARAVKGSTAAAHSASDSVFWLQHDIELTYGSATLSAWVSDDDYKPIITLASSSNTVFDYDEFGNHRETRTGAWLPRAADVIDPNNGLLKRSTYDESEFPNHPGGPGREADPWEVLGLQRTYYPPDPLSSLNWAFVAPCYLTGANFQNGKKYAEDLSGSVYNARLQSRSTLGSAWVVEHTLTEPTIAATWQTWSQNLTWTAGQLVNRVRLNLLQTHLDQYETIMFEAGDVTLTFDSAKTPTVTEGAEVGNYTIDAVLTNKNTGEQLQINHTMTLNEVLRIDCVNGEVIDESDSSRQNQAVTRLPLPRVNWFNLDPGDNNLSWEETGVTGVDVTIEWRDRFGA